MKMLKIVFLFAVCLGFLVSCKDSDVDSPNAKDSSKMGTKIYYTQIDQKLLSADDIKYCRIIEYDLASKTKKVILENSILLSNININGNLVVMQNDGCKIISIAGKKNLQSINDLSSDRNWRTILTKNNQIISYAANNYGDDVLNNTASIYYGGIGNYPGTQICNNSVLECPPILYNNDTKLAYYAKSSEEDDYDSLYTIDLTYPYKKVFICCVNFSGGDNNVTYAGLPSFNKLVITDRFENSDESNFGLFLIDCATKKKIQLTDKSINAGFPAISPDGSKVVFADIINYTTAVVKVVSITGGDVTTMMYPVNYDEDNNLIVIRWVDNNNIMFLLVDEDLSMGSLYIINATTKEKTLIDTKSALTGF